MGPQQTALSINAGELLAIQLGLFRFRSALQGRTVAVFCDNTTAVTSLRKEGGTWSPLLNTLAQAILRWKESLSIRLAPQFLPGSDNVLADALSRPHQLPHPVFEKTVAGSYSFLCNLSHSSLFDLLLPFPGSEVSRHGRVFSSPGTAFRLTRSIRWLSFRVFSRGSGPPRGRNSLLWLPTGLSALGFWTWSSSRWLLQ